MSKKYGFGVKLAVAALAVAGVVGSVWAAGPGMVQSLHTATMEVKLVYPYKGTIEAFPSIKGEDAEAVAKIDVTKYTDGLNPGNLGYLKISTNAPSWDVTFYTSNGGVPTAPGLPGQQQKDPTCKENLFLGTTCEMEDIILPGPQLLYTKRLAVATPAAPEDHSRLPNGSANDIVILDMAIGLAGAFPAAGKGIYAQGTESSIKIDPSRIGRDNMVKTKRGSTTPGDGPASFAECLYNGAQGSGANAVKLQALESLWGPKGTGADIDKATFWINGGLNVKGFPPPPKNGAAYFYVNIGIHPDNTPDISPLAGKTYSETFTFNLMGGF